ncbi:hypothetical protein BS50DRAFT_488055 [Corynespora cassiicola Philippines]|uniref:GST N-terminal domain-containing protein n=1 Tax=Corynespora cassiicola Philippines TaxID=1448308 RepID=A0A2T2NYJ4_CORCC|nr:hypothetical protein BS50DRAFT_488055 [Corynespora cassiicola Philippines]
MASSQKPVIFHYPASIYSHRVLWYLWLRGIPYDECIQPPYTPRPDLASLNVNYRRIPIMAIGEDVYSDSRLIISKLESLLPDAKPSLPSPFEAGVGKMLEAWTIDGGIFANSVKMIPYWTTPSMLSDSKFLDDRAHLMGGRRMTAEAMEKNRPDGLQHLAQAFELLETSFLADGRKWILGGDEPTKADIDGVWPFHWLIADANMRDSLPEEFISAKKFPKTFSWVHRFKAEMARRKSECAKPARIVGHELASHMAKDAGKREPTTFLTDDPLRLEPGDEVEVYPSDYGFTHKDRGATVGLTSSEIVIRNAKGLHLHFPRWNFRIDKVKSQPPAPSAPLTKTPKMRLIYHHGSPFARKVYMYALELGLGQHISLEKVVVCPVPFPGWSDNNDQVAAFNPMAKIPCLVPDDVPDGIFDSRMICEYLSGLAPADAKKDRGYWQMRALHACADGIMDAAVLITYELRIRKAKGLLFDEWIEGQKKKIFRGLDRFEVAAKEGILKEVVPDGPASADQVAVAVATVMTESMKYLGVGWGEGREKLSKWMEGWRDRTSLVETPPSEEWGGAGKSLARI